MARTPNPYTKLPGHGLRRVAVAFSATRCRLWLGPDHLLAMEYSGASESYRRFYFRDIEAFVIRRTAGRRNWNVFLLVMALLTAGPFFFAWSREGEGGAAIGGLVVAGFWAFFALINSVRGATCRTHIRTAVQTEELPSLGRMPVANKVLSRLQPLIIAAQGVSTPEEVGAASWGVEVPMTPGSPGVSAVKPDKGTAHGIVFCLLVAEAILGGIFYTIRQGPLSIPGVLAMFAGFVLCVVALVRQGSTDLPAGVRNAAKWALGSYILKAGVGFVYTIVYSINHPHREVITGFEIVGEPGFDVAALVCIGIGAVIGLAGLGHTLAHVRNRAAAPVP